jgi:methylenetetrahydrofolate dehydrogenase (NADP+) / methenyltetrahydrofolate cyclohydrolase
MTAKIIDGKKVSASILEKLTLQTQDLKKQFGRAPGLATVLVGEDPASQVYVRNKNKRCKEIGFQSFEKILPVDIPETELLQLVENLNQNPEVDGILVQLPLPNHIRSELILEAILPEKDVDGFHPINVGGLASGKDVLCPCTPSGVIEMLDYYDISIEGKNAVILGRSNIVGKPQAFLLLHRNATVTICHSRTKNLAEVTSSADLLVAAIGKPNYVTANMVKEGAVVIDVGINRVDGKLTGDVDFNPVAEKASYITPVPGGVGPMTIAMLMGNTLKAFKARVNAE